MLVWHVWVHVAIMLRETYAEEDQRGLENEYGLVVPFLWETRAR